MNLNTIKIASLVGALSLPLSLHAEFSISSTDIEHGSFMSTKHEFKGFGCHGDNLSPQLSWQGAPKGTKSFAITAYDPDAPTGSGWWHWQLINIAPSVTSIPTGASTQLKLKELTGTQQIRSDYGQNSFGGACPPVGDKAHRYQFTVFALNVEKLELPENPSPALVGYFLNAHAIETATLEALYKRR